MATTLETLRVASRDGQAEERETGATLLLALLFHLRKNGVTDPVQAVQWLTEGALSFPGWSEDVDKLEKAIREADEIVSTQR